MCSEIKLVISEGGKVIDTVIKQTITKPGDLIKSLEDFQKSANAALTKLIENRGDTNEVLEMDEEQSEDDDEDIPASPKKKKK